jgi:hypothetical protein
MLTDFRQTVLLVGSAAVAIALSVAPAAAQSLSLTYNLDPVNAPQLPKASPIVNRCTGFTWAAALATSCIAEMTAVRVINAVAAKRAEGSAAESAEQAAPRSPETAGAYADATPRRYELPTLGSPSESRLIRAAGGRDDFVGNARSVDLNLRIRSKYRMRSGDEGLEVYRFTDAPTENRLQQSNGGGVRQVGVELLVPFQ